MDLKGVLLGAVLLMVGFVLGRMTASSREQRTVVYQEGRTPHANPGAEAEIERMLASGQTIEAIKLYRETYGVGLKEAKDAIDARRS